MNNITLNTTSFSEQLGLYDFFNVLIYGTTFICGLCILNSYIKDYLWNNLSFQKGLGIVLLIYITGMILQEIGSIFDRNITKIYKGMNRRLLKGEIDKNYLRENKENIITNPYLLEEYRKIADQLLKKETLSNKKRFDNELVNGYIFSICQYTVSVKDKDKKTEKLRALFSMSKSLMSSFFLLSAIAILTLFINVDMSIEICETIGFDMHGFEHIIDKIIMAFLFFLVGTVFYYRAKRTMSNFLLILFGTYAAIVKSEKLI